MITIQHAIELSIRLLRSEGEEVDTGHWQGVPTEGKPDLKTLEMTNLVFTAPMPETDVEAANLIRPNLPWAEDHFQERVSRVPSNPGEQYKNWPWWRGQEDSAMEKFHLGPGRTDPQVPQRYERKFTHTYQERFWPVYAGKTIDLPEYDASRHQNRGIRYTYGDLDDVVNLLRREPHTRQATFPIFFPEDTGAVHGGRIPCTLHYHFMLRDNKLHMWYAIRSCDAVRHFRDDVYLAVRLAQWVLDQLLTPPDGGYPWHSVTPGYLHFTAYSFHVHKGDLHLL